MVELWTFPDGKHSKTCLWNYDTDTTFIAKNLHGGLLAEVMCTLRSQGGRQRDTAVCVNLFAMQGVGSHWSGCFVTSPIWLKTWCESCCSKSSWIIFWTFGWHHRGGISLLFISSCCIYGYQRCPLGGILTPKSTYVLFIKVSSASTTISTVIVSLTAFSKSKRTQCFREAAEQISHDN